MLCVCVISAFIVQMFSVLLCGRIFELLFPRNLVFYTTLQVLSRMLRWHVEHPVLHPGISLFTTDGSLWPENMG